MADGRGKLLRWWNENVCFVSRPKRFTALRGRTYIYLHLFNRRIVIEPMWKMNEAIKESLGTTEADSQVEQTTSDTERRLRAQLKSVQDELNEAKTSLQLIREICSGEISMDGDHT